MASEKDLELLDQYVSNRLTPQDKVAFEQKLASDASLKNEYTIQQRVVEKIREARVKELKTMFNNVPASSLETGGPSIVGQVALWVAVVGAVGTGSYFYFNQEQKTDEQLLAKQDEIKNEAPQTETVPQKEEATKQDSPAPNENNASDTATPSAEATEEETKLPNAPHGVTADEEPKAPVPLDVFDPSQENENTKETTTPNKNITETTPLAKSSIVVETDSNNKKYNFHYQFKGGKLYLYGTFEKNLYEIMEFFSGSKRTVFLFYKDSYYLLSEENDTIKPLAPINDPTLIKKLKDYRGTR
jgi:hypothetical protein